MTQSLRGLVVPVSAELRVDGDIVKASKVHLTFQASGIPNLVAWLAEGDSRGYPSGTTVELWTDVDSAKYWADSRLFSGEYVRFGRTRLWRGSLTHFGPGPTSVGAASFQLAAEGRMGLLNTGSQRYSQFMPRAVVDPKLVMSWNYANALSEARMDGDAFMVDPFNEIVASQIRMITDEVDADARSPFNNWLLSEFSDLNQAALDVLMGIRCPVMTFGNSLLQTSPERSFAGGSDGQGAATKDAFGVPEGVFRYITRLYASDWRSNSFLARLVNLGRDFWFGMVEIGDGLLLVPWTPFATTEAMSRFEIKQHEYNTIQALRRTASPTAGFVYTLNTVGDDFESPSQSDDPAIFGAYARPRGRQGLVNIVPGAEWLAFGSDVVAAFQTRVSAIPRGNAGGSALGDLEVGNRLAKFALWGSNWAGETLEVTCPFFRTDIAPLNNIRLELSQDMVRRVSRSVVFTDPATGDGSPIPEAVYATVDAVNIEIDVAEGSASTSYRLMAVRYDDEQQEINNDIQSGEHPIWAGAWAGIRLDEEISDRIPPVNPRGPRSRGA